MSENMPIAIDPAFQQSRAFDALRWLGSRHLHLIRNRYQPTMAGECFKPETVDKLITRNLARKIVLPNSTLIELTDTGRALLEHIAETHRIGRNRRHSRRKGGR